MTECLWLNLPCIIFPYSMIRYPFEQLVLHHSFLIFSLYCCGNDDEFFLYKKNLYNKILSFIKIYIFSKYYFHMHVYISFPNIEYFSHNLHYPVKYIFFKYFINLKKYNFFQFLNKTKLFSYTFHFCCIYFKKYIFFLNVLIYEQVKSFIGPITVRWECQNSTDQRYDNCLERKLGILTYFYRHRRILYTNIYFDVDLYEKKLFRKLCVSLS